MIIMSEDDIRKEEQIMNQLADQTIDQIKKAVYECGDILLHADRDGQFVSSKEGHGNFVTVYDKKIQEKLRESLKEGGFCRRRRGYPSGHSQGLCICGRSD